jgi:hydroxypyruvate isomerase
MRDELEETNMAHSLLYEVNCSILFTELPLLQRPAAAKAAGFDAVEFWWPFATAVPGDAEVDEFVAAVDDAGVSLVGLNFFAGDMPAGDRGLVSWPARSAEFRDNIPVVAEIGERLGCKAFNALYGNRLDGVTSEEQDDLAAENLTLAAQGVAGIGRTVLLEPVSGAPRYPLLTTADAAAVIARVSADGGPANIGLLADLYHLAVNGDDVDKAIATYTGTRGGIAHVQIADAPGRNEPGSGSLPLDRQLSDLQAAGYAGWVGLEYKPSDPADSAASFAWLPRERRGEMA